MFKRVLYLRTPESLFVFQKYFADIYIRKKSHLVHYAKSFFNSPPIPQWIA